MQHDNKELIDFYDAHKDKSFNFPILPDNIQPWDGVSVAKWFIDQLLHSNVGWLNIAVRTVNDPGYEHLPQHFTGRIECDKILRFSDLQHIPILQLLNTIRVAELNTKNRVNKTTTSKYPRHFQYPLHSKQIPL